MEKINVSVTSRTRQLHCLFRPATLVQHWVLSVCLTNGRPGSFQESYLQFCLLLIVAQKFFIFNIHLVMMALS